MWGTLAEYRSVTSNIDASILASRLRALFAFMTTPLSHVSLCGGFRWCARCQNRLRCRRFLRRRLLGSALPAGGYGFLSRSLRLRSFRPLQRPSLLRGGDDCPSASRRELPFRLRRFRPSLMLLGFSPSLSLCRGDCRPASLAYLSPLTSGRFGSGGS